MFPPVRPGLSALTVRIYKAYCLVPLRQGSRHGATRYLGAWLRRQPRAVQGQDRARWVPVLSTGQPWPPLVSTGQLRGGQG